MAVKLYKARLTVVVYFTTDESRYVNDRGEVVPEELGCTHALEAFRQAAEDGDDPEEVEVEEVTKHHRIERAWYHHIPWLVDEPERSLTVGEWHEEMKR